STVVDARPGHQLTIAVRRTVDDPARYRGYPAAPVRLGQVDLDEATTPGTEYRPATWTECETAQLGVKRTHPKMRAGYQVPGRAVSGRFRLQPQLLSGRRDSRACRLGRCRERGRQDAVGGPRSKRVPVDQDDPAPLRELSGLNGGPARRHQQ